MPGVSAITPTAIRYPAFVNTPTGLGYPFGFSTHGPANIAHVIHGYPQDYDRAKMMGKPCGTIWVYIPRQMVAEKYVQAFQKAINEKQHDHSLS